jgi:hypothetical protein
MSRHIQFESGMSLPVPMPMYRIAIKPSEEGVALLSLYNAISGTTLPVQKN